MSTELGQARSLEKIVEMAEGKLDFSQLLSTSLDPFFWRAERAGKVSSWWGHVPFAFGLMAALRPRVLVELGTRTGVSYSAFCEAVLRDRIETRCFAIAGREDENVNGSNKPASYWDFRAFHDEKYASFSKFLQVDLDEALETFRDGTVDLLHFNAYRSESSIERDFEKWLPKLSDRAVVLIHPTNHRQVDIGVWRFWARVAERYPRFEFLHSYGLGVLRVGTHCPAELDALFSLANTPSAITFRERLGFLGDRWTSQMWIAQAQSRLESKDAEVARLEESLNAAISERSRIMATQEQVLRARNEASSVRQELAGERARFATELDNLRRQLSEAQERERIAIDANREREEASNSLVESQKTADKKLRLEIGRLRSQAETARRELAQALRERDSKLSELSQLTADMDALRMELRHHVSNTARVNVERDLMKDSWAWRLASPMRSISRHTPRKVKGIFRRGGSVLGQVLTLSMTGSRREVYKARPFTRLVKACSLFDSKWYLEQNPDVAAARMDPALHYVLYGGKEGRNASPLFDSSSYLNKYSDVAAAGLNPLVHFILYGAKEEREVFPAGFRAQVGIAGFTGQDSPERLSASNVPLVTQVLKDRFEALTPLKLFSIPGEKRRLTIVTDSINSGSLYGGVGTALILSALLSRRLGAGLRLVTRTQEPDPSDFRRLLSANGIEWEQNLECLYSPPSCPRGVPVTDRDMFITTSWWTTQATLGSVAPSNIIYLLQEDERMFYPFGDDRLRCEELLKNKEITFVVNSELLFQHLTTGPEALPGVRQRGMWFEPAFPARNYFPSAMARYPSAKGNFFFYARPTNLRNLYWRGLEAISSALEERILRPEEWDFYFAGRSLTDIKLPGNVQPILMQDMPWEEYAALVRKMDVGLCLMYTPHPSYPPLDLAASGAVVVTNSNGNKQSLSRYSDNLICVEPSLESLRSGIEKAVALASNEEQRFANYSRNGFLRDWSVALDSVVQRLSDSILGSRG